MSRLLWFWMHFLRLWECIDLSGAKHSGNWEAVSDCRCRIADLDRRLDGLGCWIGKRRT